VKLTKDFSSEEFDTPREPWPTGKDENRRQLAIRAQWLRDLAGVPGQITSAARSDEDNAAVGGSSSSQHLKAEAIDVLFPLCPLRTLAERALADVKAKRAPAFGQLIFYAAQGHVHVSLATLGARNGEILLASKEGGKTTYAKITKADDVPALSAVQLAGVSVASVVVAGTLALALIVLGDA
jgi:hypothetical protein